MLTMMNAYEVSISEEMAKFGAYFSSKYGITPSAAISLVLGCVCLYMFVKRRREPKQRPFQQPFQQPFQLRRRSTSLASLYGGDFALRRLDDYNIAKALPSTLERSDLVLKGLLEEEHLDLNKLQSVAARLEIAGKEDEGARILEEAKKKNAQMGKSHHVYEIEMLLVEMLIYMGKHDEAKGCACLQEKMMALDARRPLFKAIIYGMREEWANAENFWNKFVELRQEIMTKVGQEGLSPEIKDFENFKKKVKHLHDEINRRVAKVYSGDVALRRIKDFNRKASPDTPPHACGYTVLKSPLLQQLMHHDLMMELQRTMGTVDMAEMGDEGVKLISDAAKRSRDEAAKSLEAYEIEMALVEVLIYKGRFDEALQCQCLNRPQKPLDARPSLFKAIIYGMRDEWEKAEKSWKEFENVREKSMAKMGQKGLVHEVTYFQVFKEIVQHFRNEIDKKNP